MKATLLEIVPFLLMTALARPSPRLGAKSTFTVRRQIQASANKIIPVVVGGAQDTFVPNSIQAAVGDIVQFQFSNGNHTVTQSAADTPCQPLQATVATAINSGHIPYEAGQATVGTFNMPVLSADPMFLYCATGPHCQEGQVMVVNPIDAQQVLDYAKISTASGQSGDGLTVVGGTIGTIPLEAAAFVPAPEEEGGGGGAPPAEAPPADPAAADPAAAPGTTTTTITVQPTPTEAPAAPVDPAVPAAPAEPAAPAA